ncbi:MAG: NADH-quinone oxidoreductase subunit N [Myxococcaceae bacterium]|nr:NADH-quinone oxidoreductase subunit N [Myxococcaceae bacterium]
MTTPHFPLSEFMAVLPAAMLVAGAIVLMLSEVFLSAANRTYMAVIGLLTSAVAGLFALNNAFEPARLVLQGFAVLDPFSSFMTVMVCLGTGLACLLASGFLKHRNAERGEFYALMLFAAAGMSLLALSNEFITLFVNLEVLSVATYALTAFLRRGPRPAEAGFKYFILGAFAAALLLYGAALLYGATGTTRLSDLAQALPGAMATKAGLVYAGFGLVLAGFAFKVAAVPFHMWTPDVYEGAPTPVTALMSVGVKAAAFVALVRTFLALVHGLDPQVPFTLFALLALLTMVAGNLLAMPQRNVKRMLAYSSIAHAGYLLLGVTALFVPPTAQPGDAGGVLGATPLLGNAAVNASVYKGILFYLLGYTVTSIGAFGTLAAIERREDETRGNTWDLERLAGLAQRQPGWAAAMAAFMLSLAGVPPTVGFLGKLFVFSAAIDAGLIWLAVVGVLASVAGTYYYLRVVVYMFMRPAPADAPAPFRHWTIEVALVTSAVATVALGIVPGPVSEWLSRAGMVFGG